MQSSGTATDIAKFSTQQVAMHGPDHLTRTRSTAMKTKTIVSALILSFAAIGAAQATPRGDSDNTPFQGVYGQQASSTSRDQVVAQLEQARAAGLTANADSDNAPFTAQADVASVPAVAQGGGVHGDIAFGDIDNQPFEG
ncbi:hypothetical protein CAL26_27100 [Bordetella genomosp. 9]|uniref:DUF4148 domain-containing protein n=2 Tax=Bordetella genomosp. 9 TaxID=1416803 RepID=A0A261R8J0_9BORD|nr:hypothetical protein CAL26_27100 [Bordetella genomosp. 9]